MKRSSRVMFLSGLLMVFGTAGCSSDKDKPEAQEEVKSEEGGGDDVAATVPEPAPAEAAVAPVPEAVPAPVAAAIAPTATSAGFNPGNYLFVKKSALNVRSAPGKTGKTISKLDYGTKVIVMAKEGPWIKIRENEWVAATGLTTQYQYVNKNH